jgi:hypothetical protein
MVGVNAVVIILWRPGDPWRERLYAFTRPRWETLDLPIIEADDPRGLFAARNTGARAAGAWDAALFVDADIALVNNEHALEAIAVAASGAYVAAYTDLITLSEGNTLDVLAGADLASARAEKRYWGSWVAAVAIGRALFDEIRGYDERFAPFSGQDVAIVHAAATLARLERVDGSAVHLWHPRGGEQLGHPPKAHPTLWPAYKRASGNPAAMRKLLAR